MRLITFLLALISLLAISVANPTPNTALTIPDPTSPTYETELTAVIARARSAGVTRDPGASSPPKLCGIYINVNSNTHRGTYATHNMICTNTEGAKAMQRFYNWHCGFCIVFEDFACQGAIKWNGGGDEKDTWGHEVYPGRSYYCLS
ncbi:hypothetical protein BDW02DRAFT_632248 [Decorospora gaudefroyi]|uniref:Uncharacterized protein n=1 Tax=Decorospora gaudefroyi TaxID=184978 RepID=A0A6A5K4J0_9PLEO|nr:hypothetical protein BDW02DRAFT_632248 [Decorospora gaudefroyi]